MMNITFKIIHSCSAVEQYTTGHVTSYFHVLIPTTVLCPLY